MASGTPSGDKAVTQPPPHLCNTPHPQCIGKGRSPPPSHTQGRPPGCSGQRCPWKDAKTRVRRFITLQGDRQMDRWRRELQGPSLQRGIKQLLWVSPSWPHNSSCWNLADLPCCSHALVASLHLTAEPHHPSLLLHLHLQACLCSLYLLQSLHVLSPLLGMPSPC